MKIRDCLLMFCALTLVPIAGCAGEADGAGGALPIDTHEIVPVHGDADAATPNGEAPYDDQDPCVTTSEFPSDPCPPDGDEACDPYQEYPAGHDCAPDGDEECDPYKEYAIGDECWPPMEECDPYYEYPDDHRCKPPEPEGRCWITGGGQLDSDAFGGNAKPFRDGRVDGEWNHVTDGGDHFHGDPRSIVCSDGGSPGAGRPTVDVNQADFAGPGTWNGVSGYTFEATVVDHGEPGRSDYYSLRVSDSMGAVVYAIQGTIDHGNIQVHPPNPGHP